VSFYYLAADIILVSVSHANRRLLISIYVQTITFKRETYPCFIVLSFSLSFSLNLTVICHEINFVEKEIRGYV